MTYTVNMKVECSVDIDVVAASPEDALKKAKLEFVWSGEDLSNAVVVGFEPVNYRHKEST